MAEVSLMTLKVLRRDNSRESIEDISRATLK